MSKLNYFGLSDRGRVRSQNEDNWFADVQQGLFMVSDGMGGQTAGALASKIVVGALPLLIQQQITRLKRLTLPSAAKRLRIALCDLSRQLCAKTQGDPGLAGMGATVVLALIRRNEALIAHMGDSRAYLARDGQLKRLTKDHSIVQLLVDGGEIKAEDAAEHPMQNRLTRFVGMQGEPLPDVQFFELRGGDRLLLCTDGLTTMVNDEQLRSILQKNIGSEAICKQLVEAANVAGGQDNITVVSIDVGRSAVSKPG